MEQRRTAIHEAGHAVAAQRLGRSIGIVTILAEETRLGFASSEDGLSVEAARGDVLKSLAGYAALAAVDEPDPEAGCNDDFEQAADLLEFWRLAGTLDEWKAKAVGMMREPENLKAVAVVADQLLVTGRLEGDQVDMLVELADGNVTRADYDKFERNRVWAKSQRC